MLSNISWSSFTTTVLVFLVLYYAIVVFKFYPTFFKDFVKRKSKNKQLREKENTGKDADELFGEFSGPFDTLEDCKELYNKLQDALTESNFRDLSKEEFTNYLSFILVEYPFVKMSSLREKINSLMVLECANYPQLILSYCEFDALWDRTND